MQTASKRSRSASPLWRVTATYEVEPWPVGPEIGRTWGVDLVNTRTGEARTVRVDIASDLGAAGLPEECEAAVRTRGRAALESHLDDDMPPWRVIVTRDGLESMR